jgi:hypothetical protein
MPTFIEAKPRPTSPRRHVDEKETIYPRLRQDAQHHPIALLPLYHFKRLFVADLSAQIFKSDGQMPTAYPPQIFGLEFTE